MDWGDIAEDVAKAAPLLGNLLPGVGTVAGAGVGAVASIVASALGVTPTPADVQTALQTDPAAYEKLREAELANSATLAQLTLQKEQSELAAQNAAYAAEAADRDSARQLAAKQPSDFMRPLLGIVIVGASVAIAGAVITGVAGDAIANPTAAITIGTVIGYVFSEAKSVLGFYFGMTRDGSEQAKTIAAFATTPGTVSTGPAS